MEISNLFWFSFPQTPIVIVFRVVCIVAVFCVFFSLYYFVLKKNSNLVLNFPCVLMQGVLISLQEMSDSYDPPCNLKVSQFVFSVLF